MKELPNEKNVDMQALKSSCDQLESNLRTMVEQ